MSTIILKIQDSESGELEFTAMSETGYNGASRAHQFCKALNEHFPEVLKLLENKVQEGRDGQRL